jgi:hypothetical protein
MRRELGHLILARTVYRSVLAINAAFSRGDDAEARRGLSILAREIDPIVPQVEQVMAELESAKAADRTQSTLAAIFDRKAEPKLHASNDHDAAPPEPAPIIA